LNVVLDKSSVTELVPLSGRSERSGRRRRSRPGYSLGRCLPDCISR